MPAHAGIHDLLSCSKESRGRRHDAVGANRAPSDAVIARRAL